MNIDFKDFSYLKEGNERQQATFKLLSTHCIFDILHQYDPILVGTIPIEIDIANSDLDIICYTEDLDAFKTFLVQKFGHHTNFKLWQNHKSDLTAVVANFIIDNFELEIFGQNIPTEKQNAYRHMLIEYCLLQERGADFRNEVIALKESGIKTEPAFALLLGLQGDPYQALFAFEK